MMKVSDMLGILLIVVVKNCLTMVTEGGVQVVQWKNMTMNAVKWRLIYSLLLRVKVKMSMCVLIG